MSVRLSWQLPAGTTREKQCTWKKNLSFVEKFEFFPGNFCEESVFRRFYLWKNFCPPLSKKLHKGSFEVFEMGRFFYWLYWLVVVAHDFFFHDQFSGGCSRIRFNFFRYGAQRIKKLATARQLATFTWIIVRVNEKMAWPKRSIQVNSYFPSFFIWKENLSVNIQVFLH